MDVLITISISFLLVVAAYAMVSLKEGTHFHVLSPSMFIFVPVCFFLEPLHIYYFGYSGSFYAYFFCYVTYALSILAFSVTYIKFSPVLLTLPLVGKEQSIRYSPYVFVVLSLLIYAPVLWQYSDIISAPREIYKQTRTGYGPSFFLSIMLAYVAFTLILFKKKRSRLELSFVSAACTILLVLHGNKSAVVTMLFIAMLYTVYVKGVRVGLTRFFGYGLAFVGLVTFLFAVTLPEDMRSDLLQGISSYSDYTRNAMLVIDSDMPLQLGKLTLENNIYAVVPRELFPEKPKNFGTFFLAERFYPEWFLADTGSPAFGIGVQYADFGPLSILYIVFWAVISGALLKIFVTRLRYYRNPADFVMVLFLAEVPLLSVGAGYLLIEHMLLALLVALIVYPIKFRMYKRSAPNVA